MNRKEKALGLIKKLNRHIGEAMIVAEELSELIFTTPNQILRFQISHYYNGLGKPNPADEYWHCLNWDKIEARHAREDAESAKDAQRQALLEKLNLTDEEYAILGLAKQNNSSKSS